MKNLYQQVSIMMKTRHMLEGSIPEFNTVKLHFKNEKHNTILRYYSRIKNEIEMIDSVSLVYKSIIKDEKQESFINWLFLSSSILLIAILIVTLL